MFEKILVPLDGSLLAERVLPHVAAIAKACGAQVILLRVMEGASGQAFKAADPLTWQMRRMEGEAYLEDVRCRLAALGVETRFEMLEGTAARRIVEQAQVLGSDLLALSTHGRSGLAPWSAGSVAQKVLESVKSSVLLVRAFEEHKHGPTAWSYERVVVPLDGSRRAEAALPLAVRLAESWQAKLLLLHAVGKTPTFGGSVEASEEAELAQKLMKRHETKAAHYLRRVQGRLTARCEALVVQGDKLSVKIAEAVQGTNDLVLASAHGDGCDRRRRFGSVIGDLIHYGRGPLLIFQDMQPQQMWATAPEQAAEEVAARNVVRDARPLLRPERIEWHTA